MVLDSNTPWNIFQHTKLKLFSKTQPKQKVLVWKSSFGAVTRFKVNPGAVVVFLPTCFYW